MSGVMRPIPYRDLVLGALAQLRQRGTIFDIPVDHFHRPARRGAPARPAAPLLGPAAGPHTQLAQNILCAYLAGARAIELKTVQVLDHLEIAKPCIDAADEGYNVEWSQELDLDASYGEYLKAWFALHLAETLLEGAIPCPPSFAFTMSVGYDLDGIRSAPMDRFIDRLVDSGGEELVDRLRRETAEIAARPGLLAGTGWEDRAALLGGVADAVSPRLSSSVTLSTMHGCPPAEIEAIARYLLEEKGLDTLVKLNPTLLGHDRVRAILDGLGWDHVRLDQHGFAKDLAWDAAVPMLRRLLDVARRAGRTFGVKLTNTLATANTRGVLPGDEMYLSGRALYPLSIALAADLATAFGGRLPMSLSGGAASWNLAAVLDAGLEPVTLATELLKPGGYGRLKQLAEIAEAVAGLRRPRVSAAKLRRLAAAAAVEPRCRKEWHGDDPVRVDGPLPLLDCFVAPCVAACPIGQDVPGYVRLAGRGRLAEAFALVHEANPLPFITAHLCDHQCMSVCTRRDWEGPVLIRDVKRVVAEGGCPAFRTAGWPGRRRAPSRGVKAAVIGAGPAGLAAAAFLAREGFDVEVHERGQAPGGVIRHAVPGFRIPDEAIRRDVELLGDLGVSFRFGSSPTVADLRAAGARHVLAAVGAPLDAPAGVEGARGALEFLREYRADPRRPALGRSVAVIGAGDTAMDAARAARRCRGVREVTVVYRRTAREMPASPEEYDAARAEGVAFRFLAAPERRAGRTLACREMTLGDPGPDGRRRPVATDRTFDLEADTVIAAVGSGTDAAAIAALEAGGAVVIGDAATGPATIVKAIASAREAVREIVDRGGGPRWEVLRQGFGAPDDALALRAGRDRTIEPADASRRNPAADANLRAVEAARCLGCEVLCLKCVEVCPNRANTYVSVRDGLRDAVQVIHLDALCNECGNCATFCPWDGKPYTDKLTVYVTEEDFRAAANPGFLVDGGRLLVRLGGTVREAAIGADGRLAADALPPGPDAGPARAVIEAVLRDHRYLLGGHA